MEEEHVHIAMHEQVVRLQDEREHLLSECVEAREINRRMYEFLSMVTHELKSPLAAIKGNVQLAERRLKRGVLREGSQGLGVSNTFETEIELLQGAGRQIGRLDRLVSDLLDISRIQVGKMEMSFAPCDLVAIVRDAVEEQQITVPKRIIRQDIACTRVAIIADAGRIGQVVSNYLSNALKYSPEMKPVEVCLRVDDREAHVAVRDEGPGIPHEEHEHIWERFHQVNGIREHANLVSGLGLGLYISKTIIMQHQGHIGLQSIPGEGSTFWFTLPIVQATPL